MTTITITLPRAVVEQALEALEAFLSDELRPYKAAKTSDALRAALAQQAEPVAQYSDIVSDGGMDPRNKYDTAPPQQAEPAQEPYCYVYEYDGVFGMHREFYPKTYNGQKPSRTVPVYTAQPQRKPLTSDKDRPDQGATYVEGYGYVDTRAVRAVERAHGIGGQE